MQGRSPRGTGPFSAALFLNRCAPFRSIVCLSRYRACASVDLTTPTALLSSLVPLNHFCVGGYVYAESLSPGCFSDVLQSVSNGKLKTLHLYKMYLIFIYFIFLFDCMGHLTVYCPTSQSELLVSTFILVLLYFLHYLQLFSTYGS